jgi:hypothetical protein
MTCMSNVYIVGMNKKKEAGVRNAAMGCCLQKAARYLVAILNCCGASVES